MKLTSNLVMLALLAGSASAQGVYAQSVQKAKSTAAQVQAQNAAADPTAPKTEGAKPAAGKPDGAPTAQSAVRNMNRRDPFVNPVVSTRAGGDTPACTTGKRCLAINQITIKGIIKSKDGMLALVENAGRRAFVLRENDAVFNGQVLKITGDAVIFREKVMDNLGREAHREVVKKLTPAA